jgi:ADP-heptose:LPS heptosyltransferase/GT2 family glycosyltransferase
MDLPISYFAGYDILSRSSWFDSDFYRRQNPSVDQAGHDPIGHYLEIGAGQGRDPHPDFDTAHYLAQCAARGESADNPLIHYLRVGAALGLTTRPSPSEASAAPSTPVVDTIALDLLSLTPLAGGGLSLKGAGWLVPSRSLIEMAVELQGEIVGFVTHGLNRPDVAASYPEAPGSETCGFSFMIGQLPPHLAGSLELTLTARLENDTVVRGQWRFEVPDHGPAWNACPPGRREGIEALGAPPVRLQVDDALVDDHGLVTLEGWVVALAPVSAVEIWLDGDRLGAAEFGIRRDDVAENYPDYLNPAFSGFRFVADSRPLGEGKRTFTVRCATMGGLAREIAVPLVLRPATRPLPIDGDAEMRVHCDDVRLAEDGSLIVSGWAIAAKGVAAVLLFLDGMEIGEARGGLERPDVGNSFPTFPGSRNAGFAFSGVVAPDGVTGEHLLSVRIRTLDGQVRGTRLPVAAVPVPAVANAGSGVQTAPGVAVAIDAPGVVNGRATAPVRGSLSIAGWALANRGIASVDIAIDGARVTTAYYGVRRDDVAVAFPDHPGSLLSGFAALLPNRVLPKGEHVVSLIARDKEDGVATLDFTVEVQEIEEEEPGPWSLRRRMPWSEVDLQEKMLAAADWRPAFSLLLRVGSSDAEIAAARRTLQSLRDQAYGDWRVVIAGLDGETEVGRLKRRLLRGFDELRDRVFWAPPSAFRRGIHAILRKLAPPGGPLLTGILTGGDELGVDALLSMATWTALNPGADLVYSDERRLNPGTGKLDAFFKPDWSPDLALSTNYIGRFWCARPDVLRDTEATLGEVQAFGEYDLVLRCLEKARCIGHLPAVLCERATQAAEPADREQAALERALARRGIAGRIVPGCAPGLYDVERSHAITGLVSIIIPTCAAKGYIKTCIETLRARTAYRNFEIVCIENIPPAAIEWRVWLKANADRVVTTEEPFNWSRFNNLAAAEARGEYLVFLNDDIEIISPNWLNVLLSHMARPEVGIAGPLLLYPDRSIQHAGLFLSHMGTARHAFRFAPEDDPGYFGLALCERNMIGVTGACLAVRRETYDQVEGFDETHTVINNDVDFCLRVGALGLLTVFTPRTKLIHHELASRSEISDDYDTAAFDDRWGETFLRGDPYFSPHLSRDHDDYSFERESVRLVYPSRPLIDREAVRRLLLLKVDHLGDCVTALPAIRRLRRVFPNARVSILAAPATKAIWALTDAIDDVIPFQFFHTRSGDGQLAKTEAELAELRGRLAPYRFDLAIDLRKSPDSRHLLQYSGARFRAGFGHQTDFPWLDVSLEWEGDPKFQSKHSHVSDDLLRLVQAVELACDGDRLVVARSTTSGSPLPPELRWLHDRPIVAIHPAAGTPTREWPAASFAQLIDMLVADFDVNVAVIGAPAEQAAADALVGAVRRKDRVASLVGKLSLEKVTAFLPRCALFVGNNSGPSHIAAALGVPTVAVHSGVVASEEWGPHGPTGIAIRRDMACSPCYISTADECHRRLACLTKLSPGDVLDTCRRFLVLAHVVSADSAVSHAGPTPGKRPIGYPV